MIYNGHDEVLKIFKTEVIEDILKILDDRNNGYVNEIVDEIID